MPSSHVVRVHAVDDGVAATTLRTGIERIQAELGVSPAFPPEVEAAAVAAATAPRLPDLDRTDVPFVTVDPPGARDLDQALHLSRDGSGYVVEYAIADVAAFVTAGDPVDLEAHRRGETLYGADSKVPLHPAVLSEGAASLLPGEVRPALLWTIRLDDEGTRTDVRVERALVRSTAQLSYEEAQAAIDGGTASESLALLREVGELRILREAARGGVSLPLPEQEVEVAGDRWRLDFREQLPVELWNAQLSLLTGFAAADLMLYARIGLLRTLPPPDPRDVQRLHRTARALGIDWPAEQLYPDFIRALDPAIPAHAAMVTASTRLLRGSGYVAFDGETPAQPLHSALAEQYAHVTAPLRRLGDRYAGEVCLALCAGTEVPDWVRAALPALPKTLQASGSRARGYERAVLDLVEAGVLAGRVGGGSSTGSWSTSTRTRAGAAWSSCTTPTWRRGWCRTGRCRSAPTSACGWRRQTSRRAGWSSSSSRSGAPRRDGDDVEKLRAAPSQMCTRPTGAATPRRTTMTKYLLLKHYRGAPAAVNDVPMERWTPEEISAHVQYMQDFADRLESTGEFVDGQALAPEGTFVRYDGPGRPPVTDGPFAETKDLIAGWMVIDVDSYDRAVELAGELSAAPGAGGQPIHEWLELRPFLSAPPTITE